MVNQYSERAKFFSLNKMKLLTINTLTVNALLCHYVLTVNANLLFTTNGCDMKELVIKALDFEATKNLIIKRGENNSKKRWEKTNIEIAEQVLVHDVKIMQLAGEHNVSKQNIHRIINAFMEIFINNLADLEIYRLTKEEFDAATGQVDKSSLSYAINAILQNSYIMAAFRIMVLAESIEVVEQDTGIDRKTIAQIVQMIHREHLNNERVKEWQAAEPMPSGWVKVSTGLPVDKARLVAQLEREANSEKGSDHEHD